MDDETISKILPLWGALTNVNPPGRVYADDRLAEEPDLGRQWYLSVNVEYLKSIRSGLAVLKQFVTHFGIEILSAEQDAEELGYMTILMPAQNAQDPVDYLRGEYLRRQNEQKPQLLTEVQIEDILSVIPPVLTIDREIADMARQGIVSFLRQQLMTQKLTPMGIDLVKQSIYHKFQRAQISAGTMTGTLAAMALMHPLTQITLKSFHQSGSAPSVSVGIDAARELINASPARKYESCSVFFRDQQLSYADIVGKRGEFISGNIKSLLIDYDIKPPIELGTPWWHSTYQGIVGHSYFDVAEKEIDEVPFMLRLYFDVNLLFARKITLQQIIDSIAKHHATDASMFMIPSPGSHGIIDMIPIEKMIPSALSACWKAVQKRGDRERLDQQTVRAIGDTSIFTMLQTCVVPELDKITVRGISGITDFIPNDPKDAGVWAAIRNQRRIVDTADETLRQRGWILEFNHEVRAKRGISTEKINSLLAACGAQYVEHTRDSITIVMPDLLDELWSLITIVSLVPESPVDAEFRSQWVATIHNDVLIRTKVSFDQLSEILSLVGIEIYEYDSDIDPTLAIILMSEAVAKNLDARPLLSKPDKWILYKIAVDTADKEKIETERRKTDRFYERPRTLVEITSNLFYAITSGANLTALFNHPDIDETRTICNNVQKIYETFGIEAARTFLIRELDMVIKASGSFINQQNITLVADFMTNLGFPTPMTHSGISRQPIGSLSKASVERAMDHFIDDASVGKLDPLRGTTEFISVGQRARIGTGIIDTYTDTKKYDEYHTEIEMQNAQNNIVLRKAQEYDNGPNVDIGFDDLPPDDPNDNTIDTNPTDIRIGDGPEFAVGNTAKQRGKPEEKKVNQVLPIPPLPLQPLTTPIVLRVPRIIPKVPVFRKTVVLAPDRPGLAPLRRGEPLGLPLTLGVLMNKYRGGIPPPQKPVPITNLQMAENVAIKKGIPTRPTPTPTRPTPTRPTPTPTPTRPTPTPTPTRPTPTPTTPMTPTAPVELIDFEDFIEHGFE